MAELKPCPFCAGNVKYKVGFGKIFYFKCPNCGAVVSFDADQKTAFEAWNRRADNG